MDTIEVLKRLCLAVGITKHENECGIGTVISDLIKPYADQILVDDYGNVMARVGIGGSKKVIIDAHLDEVGFKVNNIEGEIAQIDELGSGLLLPGDRVRGFTIDKHIEGTIDFTENRRTFIPDNSADINRIQPGDLLSYARAFRTENEIVSATALDNRISCALLIDLAKNIKLNDIELVLSFSSREELDQSDLGQRAMEEDADFVIVVDSAYAKPVNFPSAGMTIPTIGEGVAVQHHGKGFVVKKKIIDDLVEIATSAKINYQFEIPTPDIGRTNFSEVQAKNIPGCVLNIPVRDQHKQYSITSMKDYNSAFNLICEAIDNIDLLINDR